MVLNLWVEMLFGVTYQVSCVSDIYIMKHNSSKITAMVKGSAQHEELGWRVAVLGMLRTLDLAWSRVF